MRYLKQSVRKWLRDIARLELKTECLFRDHSDN